MPERTGRVREKLKIPNNLRHESTKNLCVTVYHKDAKTGNKQNKRTKNKANKGKAGLFTDSSFPVAQIVNDGIGCGKPQKNIGCYQNPVQKERNQRNIQQLLETDETDQMG